MNAAPKVGFANTGINSGKYLPDKFSQSYRQMTLFLVMILLSVSLFSQSHNYWTRSFNEESSLLSGAVVGGGAGPSAIYYNPAGIAEITTSSFSLHASLFSFEFLTISNALGKDIDLKSLKVAIEPRFLSYMIQPKNRPHWSFEIALLNNENFRQEFTSSVDKYVDVLHNIPGQERYFALFSYSNHYRDDWVGFGGSWKPNPHLSIGASMFVTIRQLRYQYSLDIEAFPHRDSIVPGGDYSFYSANYQDRDELKFNDYRLLWKFGIQYRKNRWSAGISLTTPSVGGIYSDGKQVTKKQKQSNISNPETGLPLPDYVIVDYKEKKDVTVNAKSPLSVAAGLTYRIDDGSRILYTSVEYFAGLDPYRLVAAKESSSIIAGSIFEIIDANEWLTFVSGAKPLVNAAIGYRWQVKPEVMLMAGFRTDFNYRKDLSYQPFLENKKVNGPDLDLYHFSTGLTLRILGQDLIAGFQYTVSRSKNVEQYANLSDPVEFNFDDLVPLQGTRTNTMNTFLNAISLYFGATFNFK